MSALCWRDLYMCVPLSSGSRPFSRLLVPRNPHVWVANWKVSMHAVLKFCGCKTLFRNTKWLLLNWPLHKTEKKAPWCQLWDQKTLPWWRLKHSVEMLARLFWFQSWYQRAPFPVYVSENFIEMISWICIPNLTPTYKSGLWVSCTEN